VIDVHLKGHFSLLHNAARHWRERAKAEDGLERERSFLCVSSDSAKGRIGQGNYAAAKAGILGLMRTAARELDQYDVRVNAFWPAALTRMTEDILEGVDEEAWGPHAVTGVPVFLASERADGITGCTVGLRGGELSFVSDPEYERVLERDATEEGPWTAELVADRWDDLTAGYGTDNSEPR
jgi:NAD(P)-dependent dehydrogenase (short-subunit alcohol dehydrogenase family)